MKKLFVLVLILVVFSSIVNAQSKSNDNIYVEVQPTEEIRFFVSTIYVVAPDDEDVIFLQSAIREELIRSKKINLVDKCADTLVVNLIIQHNVVNSDKGRNGKWGEVLITILSNNGLVAGTSRGFVESYEGGMYYKILRDIVKNLANNFQYD